MQRKNGARRFHQAKTEAFPAAVVLTAAILCGGVAFALGIRAPWFFGGLVGAFVAALVLPRARREHAVLPPLVRQGFIALVAVIFGTQLSAQLGLEALTWWPSLAVVILFVLAAQIVGFQFFRRVGGFDPATAWFAASPGGLVENIAQGEAHGANEAEIAVMQFLRVMLILFSLPLLYSIWFGLAPFQGSGLFSAAKPAGWTDTAIFVACAALGLGVFRATGIAGVQLILPFFLGAGLIWSGWSEGAVPRFAIIATQIIIGTSLGTQISLVPRARLAKAIWLAIAHVLLIMGLAVLFCLGLSVVTDTPVWLGLLILAPAGIAEMGIIALTLGANPIFVIAHHVLRIGVTIIVLPRLFPILVRDQRSP